MRCARCGARAGAGRDVCPRCGRGLPSKRPPVRLYRDRRRRLRCVRRLKWAAIAIAALLALALLIALLSRRPGGPGPAPGPSPAPTAPTPTAEIAPEPSAEPTPEPTAAPGEGGVRPPKADIATQEELIDLYWWMIENGEAVVSLDSLEVGQGDISDITDKFSNYFNKYRAYFDPPAVRVEFKPGILALRAIQTGDESALTDEAKLVADEARAVVSEIIRPDMSDWEKELAIHDYVVNNCQYTLDILAPHSGDAYGFFKYGECRCAGYCDVFRLLGRLSGLEVEMIGGPTSRDASGSKGHAWSLVRLDGLWYVVDTAWDDLIEDVPTLEHTFFNVPYACFDGSREWDAAYLPGGDLATALDGNYYFNRPEYVAHSQEEGVALAVAQLDASGKAYLILPEKEWAKDIAAALTRHYGRKGDCFELSEDLNFNLFRFRLPGVS